MTHDELLARISELSFIDDLDMTEEYLSVEALRAVVELHKPTETGGCSAEYIDCHSRSGLMCDEYCNTYVAYPCKTIRTIEKELK